MTKKKDIKDSPKMGRPSAYKPEYCEMLINHLNNGLQYDSFAGVIGVTYKTLYNWEKEHVEFLHAKEIGIPKGHLYWDKLNIAACNGKAITIDGEVIDPKNINATIMVFNMKNRFGWRSEPRDIQELKESVEKLIVDLGSHNVDKI